MGLIDLVNVCCLHELSQTTAKKVGRVRYFLSFIMVLLERLEKEKKLRYTIGLFLSMTIILSNAYRNNNVYNMISPSKISPHRHLHELLSDGFNIYTKIVDIQDGSNLKKLEIGGGALKYDNSSEVIFLTFSEVADAIQRFVDVLLSEDYDERTVDDSILVSSMKTSRVLSGAKIHP